MKTYGEYHTEIKLTYYLKKGEWVHDVKPPHLPRMNEEDAALYYTNKLREHYGLPKKKTSSYGAFKHIVPRQIRKGLKLEPTMKEFDKSEHDYDYHEAIKLSKELKIA